MTVVHCQKDKYDVYIGRPSKWGNPFTIGPDGGRIEVIKKYRAWIKTQPHLIRELPKLKGKILGCWCKPLACHGDVLEEMIEEWVYVNARRKSEGAHRPKDEGVVSKRVQVFTTGRKIRKSGNAGSNVDN